MTTGPRVSAPIGSFSADQWRAAGNARGVRTGREGSISLGDLVAMVVCVGFVVGPGVAARGDGSSCGANRS
jgi:hypothetical protein